LSFRLFLLILAVMSVGFGFYAYQVVRNQNNQLMNTVYLSADRVSDLIKRSTRYGMLLNRKEDVHHIINTIGNEPGVDAIRIFNKKGQVVFSTNPDEINTTVDMHGEACNICHKSDEPLQALPVKNRLRIYRAEDGHRVLALANPIENEPACYNAACHAHDAEQIYLGVLDVKMSLKDIDTQLALNRKRIIIFSILMVFGVSVLSGLFIYFVVRKRIKKLIKGTEEIAAGNLDHRIDIASTDEIGQLARSFNTMTKDLQKALNEIKEWSTSLEEKVAQKQMELEKAQEHLIRMEKLASLGKLSATVAHEINNPLAGVLNYTVLILRMLNNDELSEEKKKSILEYLEIIKNEVSRCGDIVKNMLIFARQTGGRFSEEHLHQLLDSSIMLVQHHLELKQITIEKKLECENDVIFCDASQLRQALIAMYVNAIEAMDTGGKLTIHARCLKEKDMVRITISDTGSGIPEDILPNIFDPFFSTKKEGKGVGLGLAVVYGIIQRHQGTIQVESEVNKGTTFYIDLPRKPETESEVRMKAETITNN